MTVEYIWLGKLFAVISDPLLVVGAYTLYIVTKTASKFSRFLIASLAAFFFSFLSGWLESANSGEAGMVRISSFLLALIAFTIVFSLICLIGHISKTRKTRIQEKKA